MCHAAGMRPTLFEFAGGAPAWLGLATAHHARCLADPELNHPFSHPGQHPEHVQRLAWYWAEVMGGPAEFSRSCTDQSAMLRLHAYMQWAVDEVLRYSPTDPSAVPIGLPMPHWSWDGLKYP
jgi:hemoglobin